jgi:ABC-type transporter Mla maintaining outer membrane lipid asymmetry ATPase subunit MlaF
MSAAVPAAAVPRAAADPAAPRVHLADVHKRLGGRVVLDGLSLDVRAGEVYGLLGANGSGKSTAVNLVCNLLAADRGLVQVCGLAVGAARCAASACARRRSRCTANSTRSRTSTSSPA